MLMIMLFNELKKDEQLYDKHYDSFMSLILPSEIFGVDFPQGGDSPIKRYGDVRPFRVWFWTT